MDLKEILKDMQLKQASLIPNMIFTYKMDLPSPCNEKQSKILNNISSKHIFSTVGNIENFTSETRAVMIVRVLDDYLETETTKSSFIELKQSCCTGFDKCSFVQFQKRIVYALIELSKEK